MNFKLYLMRHGQAESLGEGHDFERNLTDAGRQQISRSGDFLSKYQVDKIIISYVRRTIQTASIMKEFVNAAEEEIVEYLYQSEEGNVIKMLSEQDSRYRHILVIGHNPTIYNVSMELLDSNSDGYDTLLSSDMQTGQVVVLDFPELKSWKALASGRGKLVELFRPAK